MRTLRFSDGSADEQPPTALSAAADTSAADWVVAGLHDFGEHTVRSLVPAGFPSYVRVFHPAHRGPWKERAPVRWAEIAAANGKHAHPGMQLGAISGYHDAWPPAQPGVFDDVPDRGSLSVELATMLAIALARHTTTPERCWFAVWEGWGSMRDDVRSAPRFEVPARAYHLLSGPVSAASESVEPLPEGWRSAPPEQSPSLWWPDDRAWCVATEVDLDSTYIGCSDACRDDILGLAEVEALPIDRATGITYGDDLLNPLE